MHIAWTYLLHSYYRGKGIDHRYYTILPSGRRKFDRTSGRKAYKYWELERCLNSKDSPIDKDTANNLKFLIGIRHEVEHQMTGRIDDYFSARFQATCLNYNFYIKKLFGDKHAIDKFLSFSLQFSSINQQQLEILGDRSDLPTHISKFVEGFDSSLTEDEFNSERFAYRVFFVAKTANHKGQADQVIEFVKSDSPLAASLNTQYTLIKETERDKYRASTIVKMMQKNGFKRFKMQHHRGLWRLLDAKNPSKNYGITIEGYWYWYERWVKVVESHCQDNSNLYA